MLTMIDKSNKFQIKPGEVYKMKNYKRGIMSTVIALGLCVVMGVSGFAAETIEDAEREAQILEAEREAAQAGRNVLDAQLNEIIEDMMETTEQLRLTSDAVVAAEFELVDALVDENNQYQNMKRRIQFMYENGGFRMLEMLFSSESLGEFVNQVEYINMITTADRDMLVQFQDTVDRVVVKEAALREEEEVLVELQDELIEQQETVQELLVEADVQLEDLHAKIGANYAVLADLIAQAEAERILQEQAAEAARLQEEQARAAAEEVALQAQAPANQENGNGNNGNNENANEGANENGNGGDNGNGNGNGNGNTADGSDGDSGNVAMIAMVK
jgi:peptidoglycan hydrolase CwlO-like protein